MRLEIEFRGQAQRDFYYATQRNQCFSGGFNNGKSFVGCFKALSLLLMYQNYRMIIAREKYTDLRRTTMQTFLKMCPTELINSHNEQEGLTHLANGSLIYWMHLDNVDENSLRGIEPNSILVDQAEETSEKVYDVLDARIGRWDGALVPKALLESAGGETAWPRSKTNKLIVPSYLMLLTNPDTQFHYIYRKYHPDSQDKLPGYFFCEAEWNPDLGSEETYTQALTRDSEWVSKYVRGEWGHSSSQIHFVPPSVLLEPSDELIGRIRAKGNLFRILDHGDASPTCCLWAAAIDGVYIFYREYYVASKVISYHRKAISDLSEGEQYTANYADPSIFKKASQKDNGFWSIADEYRTDETEGPPIFWLAADNNEFATRNRINELLLSSGRFRHPVTGESPTSGMYLIKQSPEYPYGCREAIRQLGAQRKKLLGTIDGKSVYSDDREDSVPDHAYDSIRYFVAMHGTSPAKIKRKAPRMSFEFYQMLAAREKQPTAESLVN